jgi:hypothetical protein
LAPGTGPWSVDVILSAPDFEIEQSPAGVITLTRSGDSTSAVFFLRSKTTAGDDERRVYATFWHRGAFVAKVSRTILVRADAPPASPSPPRPAQRISVLNASRPPDLTIWEDAERGEVTIQSPWLQPIRGTMQVPPDLAKWLNGHYAQFSSLASRGIVSAVPSPANQASRKEQSIGLMHGFGRELYRKVAPESFKEAFWRLKDQGRLNTIQVFSSNPLIPWELMRPSRANGLDETGFLGIEFDVARWHVSRNVMQLDRPPLGVSLRSIAVIAPEYDRTLALPNQPAEVAMLKTLIGYQPVPGRIDALRTLLSGFPSGIIHFVGHGGVRQNAAAGTQYVLRMEDGDLDLLAWQGFTSANPQNHPLVFLNACDTGRAEGVLNFVDGWAPKMLEAGAGAYIGGAWALGDRGAAQFSVRFYESLIAGLKTNASVTVSVLVREARRLFYDTGDPTFLGYVYYGDPHFTIMR